MGIFWKQFPVKTTEELYNGMDREFGSKLSKNSEEDVELAAAELAAARSSRDRDGA